MPNPPFLPLLLPTILLMAAACSPVDQSKAEQVTEQPPAQALAEGRAEDCLLMVWSDQTERDVEFDRAHDQVEGGAISCATGTSPSQFAAAITSLREAAQRGDKARILQEMGIPLLYIDGNGDRRELEDPETVEAIFDEIFDPAMIEVLSRLDLADMTVNEQGGFFALGTVWLVVDEHGGRPRLVTVNRQALGDAAKAARRQAERNRGEVIPFDKQ
ncbi:hypothetical protein [Qipengyuania marisflavi]|uniref:Uncharacterized protein n=1 Tax=Qipengyuania marisflavi TaxID=2486356 RepID=A0A5S3P9K5_9SPHN|nr:hypothetical protein [Qipengyuania marisflavi]TMM50202.1 hypothetical protein FEV51_03170 [Qipengyuania marisflavi]